MAESQSERNFAVDRFHDQLLARLIELRYKRLTPVHWLLMLPLKSDAPLLALAMSNDEQAAQHLLRDLKFVLPFFLPAFHYLLWALLMSSSYPPAGIWPAYWESLERVLWISMGLAMLAGISCCAVFVRRLGVVRDDIRQRLIESDLMATLAFIDERLWSILDHVPVIFQSPFMLVRRRSPQSVMDLVGSNLDWYLDEPRTLVRLDWIAVLLLPVLSLQHLMFPVGTLTFVEHITNPVWHLLGLTVAACVVSIAYAARRREVFLEELILHLRREFES